jgi:hypothetical protein
LHPIAEWGDSGSAPLTYAERFADLESALAQLKLNLAENAPVAGAAPRHSAAAGTRTNLSAGRTAPPAIGGGDGGDSLLLRASWLFGRPVVGAPVSDPTYEELREVQFPEPTPRWDREAPSSRS